MRLALSHANPHVRQDFIAHAHEPGKFHLQVVENTESALRQARLERDQEATMSQRRDLRKIATVPAVVYAQSIKEKWDTADWTRFFLLNPDYSNVVYGKL